MTLPSQWSLDDTCSNKLECAKRMQAPLFVIENSADAAVLRTPPTMLFEAAASSDMTFQNIEGATHSYASQPDLLEEATALNRSRLVERKSLAA